MSGWSDLASFAKSALTTAQKKIDNVLDIKEQHEYSQTSLSSNEDEVELTTTGAVRLHKLQEDFFSAFGLQSSSTQDPTEDSVSKEGEPSSSKAKWSSWLSAENVPRPKSSWASWLGAVPAEDDSLPNVQHSENLVVSESSGLLSRSSETLDEEIEEEQFKRCSDENLSKESTSSSLKLNDNDGWCTESLIVPKQDESLAVVDLMTPGESSGFMLPNGAQLSLVDDDDSGELLNELDSDATHEEMSANRVSSWVMPPLDVVTCPSSNPSCSKDEYSSNNVTPKANQTEFFFESDSEKSLCTLIDQNQNSSVDMSSSSKSQDTVVDEDKHSSTIHLLLDDKETSRIDEDQDKFYYRQAADCVEGILMKISSELEDFDDNFEQHSPPTDGTDEEIAGHSLAESFVQLEAQNSSPLFSQQKSETSSIIKGSGYSSPVDETETNASSDIEIISTPNGDNGSESSSRSGVTRIAGFSKKTHRRVSSDQDFTEISIPISSLQKKMSLDGSESDKKFQQLTELVDVRERKLLEISKENAQLADENEQLRRELQDVHNRISSTMGSDKHKEQSAERVSSLERKLDAITKEKDVLKRKCDNLEKEISTRVSSQQFQQMLQDKDQQIQDLMIEGEKLSRTELKHNNIVKKLREKEKENEKTIDNQRTKLLEMDNLKRKLRAKEEQELKYDEIVSDLKSTIEKQEKFVEKLKSEFEDARDKCSSYKLTLENCAKEIADLRKELATKENEIQRFLSNAEESKESELQENLIKATKEFHEERQKLTKEMKNIKIYSEQSQEEFQRREVSFRWEVNQLQQKLQEAEVRNQELSDSISTATKPLLRQIDSLQMSFQGQQNNWERLEKSLYDRLGEAERKSLNAQEKEQTANTTLAELRVKANQMENQIFTLTKEKQKMEATCLAGSRDTQAAAALQTRFAEEIESEKVLQAQILEELQKEKDLLTSQFEFDKARIIQNFEQKLTDLDKKLSERESMINILKSQLVDEQTVRQQQQSSLEPAPLPLSTYRNRSVSPSSASAIMADDACDDLWSYDVSGGGYSSFLERLRSKLQQREGEMMVLKEELRHVQNSRDAVAMSMITISNEKQGLENQLQQSAALREQYHHLDVNHQALLQMYGEKVEENEELKMDLLDVKSLYKQQLEDLLNNSK